MIMDLSNIQDNPNLVEDIEKSTLRKELRVRLSFARLKGKAPWRVQHIPMSPEAFQWSS